MTTKPFSVDDPTLSFLKSLQRGDIRGVASLLLSRKLDPSVLGDFLVNERLAVYAYAQLADLKLKLLLPRSVSSRLEEQWRQQQKRNSLLLEALGRIDAAFRQTGTDYLLLKGLTLAERCYGDTGRRFTWDLDLLVQAHEIQSALTLLQRLGFAKPGFSFGLDRLAPYVAHALECRRADGLSVDLHWAFRRLPGLRIDYDTVWRARQFQTLRGIQVAVPSDEHTLLQVLLGVAADLDRGLCRMRALWDIYLLLCTTPDFDMAGFLARREPEGTAGLVVNALALLLFRLDCRDELPSLTKALEGFHHLLFIDSPEQASAILARAPHGLQNHILFSRWQPLAPWRYWSWWAATLPLRFFFARRI
ncbi:MAG: nucleotidyltransferase family protein [Candidatus Competibacteraceae bacterium]